MAVIARRRFGRHLVGLLPRLAVGVLFLAPAAIWLAKRDQPIVDQVRTPGRILEVAELPMRPGGAADRFTVRLRNGQVIVFETDATAMPFRPGDDVVVVRMNNADGRTGYRVERQ